MSTGQYTIASAKVGSWIVLTEYDENGEVKADKVREIIEKVLEDVPAFKGTSKDDKGFKVGVSGEPDDVTEQENALRKAFGLAPKK